MTFVKVAQMADVPIGSMKRVEANDEEILLSNIDGNFYAVAERCPHLRGHLSQGVLEGSVVTCPRHDSQFDVRTGQLVGQGKLLVLRVKPRARAGASEPHPVILAKARIQDHRR